MVNVTDLNSAHNPDWCPGCGDFPILMAIKNAIANLGINPKDVVVVSGIGCSGKLPHFIKTYGFESIHGRTLPTASAIKLANSKLHVIAVGGDGDGYGIGMGHFIHAMRRNHNITYIVHDNQVYGLTKGQTSPTSDKGYKSKSTPSGVLEEPVNPLQLAITSGASFVARGFSGNLIQLTDIITKAIQHKGFSLVDVLQPCITFNKINTYQYYMQRAKPLNAQESAMQKAEAWQLAGLVSDKIPTGIFYVEEKPTYEDGLPQIAEIPLVEHPINNVDIDPLLKQYE